MDDAIEKRCFNKRPEGEGPDRPHDNYCAIRLSECFIRSGVSLSGSGGAKCWSHDGLRHVLRAEDLAAWLARNPPNGFGPKEAVAPGNFQNKLSGRTGVIFFKDYWQRGRESFANRSGDHMDLWNRSRITQATMIYRSVQEFFGFVSDLNDSKQIWFWEVK